MGRSTHRVGGVAQQRHPTVFDALGDSGNAVAAVQVGYRELMEYAEKISDLAWRSSFLENVPEHRAMIAKRESSKM